MVIGGTVYCYTHIVCVCCGVNDDKPCIDPSPSGHCSGLISELSGGTGALCGGMFGGGFWGEVNKLKLE